ncbi:MAG: 30S ribosome-binding factor RbfA [Planctomycetota bacterium]
MRDVRRKRLSEVVQRKASEVILYELKDPRMGFVTVTRVKLAGDLRHAVIFWSIVGTDGERSRTEHALENAKGYIQGQIASALKTRVTPTIRFEYDASVEGSVRVSRILSELVEEESDDPETATPEEE